MREREEMLAVGDVGKRGKCCSSEPKSRFRNNCEAVRALRRRAVAAGAFGVTLSVMKLKFGLFPVE